jgi:hypothetical protein
MGVYKLSSAGGITTPRTNYSSFLAGNPAVVFADYDSIQTVTVGAGGAASISFTSIPDTYKHLQIRALNFTNSAQCDLYLQMNGDTASNYSRHQIYGDGGSAVAASGASATNIWYGLGGSTTIGGVSILDILDYTSTNKNKVTRALEGSDQNTSGYVFFRSGMWKPTTPTAVTSITIAPVSGANTFRQYSSFALYGIK